MDKPAALDTKIQGHTGTIDSVAHDGICTRCSGLMVVDHCFDVLGDAGEIDCRVLRCIQCGDVVDPVILRNRNAPPALAPKKHVKWSSSKLAAIGYR